MIGFCLLGAGRIGAIHAANIASRPDARLLRVVDVNAAAAAALAERYGAQISSVEAALDDPDVHAVIVASATATHVDLTIAAARAGKAVFCEKPLDLDSRRAEQCLKVVGETGTTLAVGFNRRFDPDFQALYQRLFDNEIGRLELLSITSRDPEPPPIEYIRSSGGMFRDMLIHDFDMARWLLGEEPCEVYATASCLVDQDIAGAGDVDTAAVILRTLSGRLCQINASRRASYGYDQRIEAFGSKGMLRAENTTPTAVRSFTEVGESLDKPHYFFLDRYAAAYRAELDDFLEALQAGRAPRVVGEDGRRALLLADAAAESHRLGIPVKLSHDGNLIRS